MPRSRLSWGAPLGAQGEGGRDGSGGGQGQESRRRPPTGSGCGSGSRTTGRLQPFRSLKLLPAWLRAHEGQAVWSQRRRVGEEGFWQPPPHPRSRGVRAQGYGTAAWCPLVGLEDALSEAPGMGVGGRGRGSPSPKLPSSVLQKQAWAALRSQARSSEVLVWYPGPPGWGGAVLRRAGASLVPASSAIPPGCALPFSSFSPPDCSPRIRPTQCTCPDTYWVLSLWSQHGWWRWKGDREVSRLPRPVPPPHPRPGSWSLNRKFVLKGGQEFPKPVLGAEGKH